MALSKSDGAIGILLIVVAVGFSIMASRGSKESSAKVVPKAEPVAPAEAASAGGQNAAALAAKVSGDSTSAAETGTGQGAETAAKEVGSQEPPTEAGSDKADAEAHIKNAEAADLAKHEELRFPVAFVHGSGKPMKPDIGAIAEVAAKLKECPGTVILIGHSDSQGRDAENQFISQERAEQVANILMQYGIPKEKISIEAAGSTRPVLANTSEVGRQANRRVTYRCE